MLNSILSWLFFDSIYGSIAIAALVFGLFWVLKQKFPSAPHPAVFGGVAFVIAIGLLPSIPRYQFESTTIESVKARPYVREINRAYWGDLTEPLTLVKTPVGSFTLAYPSIIQGRFNQAVLRYDEKPALSIVDVDCSNFTAMVAEPDAEGVFREVSETPTQLADFQKKAYCDDADWWKERQALPEDLRN